MTGKTEHRELTTRSGLRIHVRPATPADQADLAEFFRHVTPDDLRFRFLGNVKIGEERLAEMTDVDHETTESFIATDGRDGPIIALAMLACDRELTTGEVAVSIRGDYKNRGIGWELLGFVTEVAAAKGVRRVQSLESRQNRDAIELEQERGFKARSYEGDASLVLLEKAVTTAAHP